MDGDKKAYRIHVGTPDGNAYVICVSYPSGDSYGSYGLDFYELIWSSAMPVETIPSSRVASFREELRATHQASRVRTKDADENQIIVGLIKEAYGHDTFVSLSAIDAAMPNHEI